jgi:hypothetical protein
MKTMMECDLFIRVWKGLSDLERSRIRNFLACIGISDDGSQKFPRTQDLPSVFLTWFRGEYSPMRFDRILYTDGEDELVGVVRDVNRRTGEITLYCSYSYSSRVLDVDKPTCTLGHLIRPCSESEYKRLKRELRKVGLVWKDKLHRLEPEEVKARVGDTYWYIDDKLSIVADKEKGGKSSHLRYIAGNYFTDYGIALEVCEKVREILKSSLCKMNEPED